ncbi:hypothetical protein PtA15_4A334 [Puccinia triticina]|uniref:Uncharacterized protein n=1 Tax=Puccinia triticina TaxID=208348 RepID=A0ABY7CJ88_9BASI|nr:uncharacterized protein PtA15_4A334 [Puccinia triticina]WAQ83885.1 hypothetical protein PtA15_4A334 [Puccinia triticina]
MIAPRAISGLSTFRMNTNWQHAASTILFIVFHCTYFIGKTHEEVIPFACSGVEASDGMATAPQTAMTHGPAYVAYVPGEEQRTKDGVLFPESRRAYIPSSKANRDSSSHIDTKAVLEANQPISEEDLISKDKSLSQLQKAVIKLEAAASADADLPKIRKDNLQEHENFQLLQIDWKDRFISQYRKEGTPDDLEKLQTQFHINGNPRLLIALLRSSEQVARETKVRPEGWWSKLMDFIRYFFKRDEWIQDRAALQLNKIRRGLKESHVTSANERILTAINRLSISRRKGPNFSEREIQMIENLSHDSSHLTAEDEALITEIANENFAKRTMKKIKNLQEVYSSAMEKTPAATREVILGALNHFEAMAQRGKEWNYREERKLFEILEKMKDMNDAPRRLFRNKQIRSYLENCALKWEQQQDRGIAARAFPVLNMSSRIAPEEKEVWEQLSRFWEEKKLGPAATGLTLKEFYSEKQMQIVRQHAAQFDEKFEETLKTAKSIKLEQSYLDEIGKIENYIRKEETEQGKYELASTALQLMRYRNIAPRIARKGEGYFDSSKEFDVPNVKGFSKKEVENLAIEQLIIKSSNIPIHLVQITNTLLTGNEIHLVGYESQFENLKNHFTKNEVQQIRELIKLSGDDEKLQEETKFVQLLKILIKANVRSEYDLDWGTKFTKDLEILTTTKKDDVSAAKYELQQVSHIRSEYKRITDSLKIFGKKEGSSDEDLLSAQKKSINIKFLQ